MQNEAEKQGDRRTDAVHDDENYNIQQEEILFKLKKNMLNQIKTKDRQSILSVFYFA